MDYRNPAPTVDIIITLTDKPQQPIVLVERRFAPLGWAIPGGFVDYGESLETAAKREAMEETGLDVQLMDLLYVYSDPSRDARQHTISAVFLAEATGMPHADDDAKAVGLFYEWSLPEIICFDHRQILQDFWHLRRYGVRPRP